MKKYIAIILVMSFAILLTGCTSYSYEEYDVICEVKACDEGTFVPNAAYIALATKSLVDGDITKWSMYSNLANATGKYEYNVTVIIEGKEYIVTRNEFYEVGAEIIINKKCSYADGTLIEIQYN